MDFKFQIGDLVKLRTLDNFFGFIVERKNSYSFLKVYKIVWLDDQEPASYLEDQLEKA
jgi:hypothetical protein